jgi:hypothetical protein
VGTIHILDHTGGRTYAWDAAMTSAGEVMAQADAREAAQAFAEARARGDSVFRVAADSTLTYVECFDPASERLIVLPRIIGG